jgi:hypothetical protein
VLATETLVAVAGRLVVVTGKRKKLVVVTGKVGFAMVVIAPESGTTEVVMVLGGLLAAWCVYHW